MAYLHFVPKIEWSRSTLTGTTAVGSPVVTGIADTSAVQTGQPYNMFFEGTGIPAGAVVLSKTVSTVTLDSNATVAATNTFTFGHRIEFEYPAQKDPWGQDLKWVGSVASSKSGLQQFIEDYVEVETELRFSHVTQALKDKFEWFLLSWCLAGNDFFFFADKNEATSEQTVQRSQRFTKPDFKILTRRGAGFNFSWQFKLLMRRVY